MKSLRGPCLLLVAALGCATVGQSPPDDEPELRSLDLEGDKSLPGRDIRARILTSGTSWLPFTERHYFDESVFDTDLKRIVRLYQARGYLKARIAETKVTPVKVIEGADPRATVVDVLVRIDEGAPTRVEKLEIDGLGGIPEDERAVLLSALPLRQQEVFSEDDYDSTKRQLADRLHEVGFAEAEVTGRVVVDPDREAARVGLSVVTGPRYRFGEIVVAGANQVSRNTVVAEAREALPEGKNYSESALSAAQSRIFDLGVFSTVKVTRGAPDKKEATLPIVITVREAPFRTVRAGGGVGVDPRRYELPRLNAEWVNRNFFGGLRRLNFHNELALVFLPVKILDFSHRGIAGASTLEFQQPDFFSRDLTLTSLVGYERGLDQSFRYDAVRGSLGLVWRISRSFSLIPSYNLSVFKLAGLVSAARATTTQEATLDSCAAQNVICQLAYLEERAVWDRRNNSVEPTKGGMLTISLQEGSRGLGGRYDYVRVAPEARIYFPLGAHVLAMRAQAGMLVPSAATGSSVLTRFFMGGATSQRGFGNRALSPAVEVLSAGSGGGTEALPLGGEGMLGGNVEMRFALPANFGLVAFVDAGEVQPTMGDLSVGGVNVAVGTGLRYRTPFGPVRLDFAYRLNDRLPPIDRLTTYADGQGTLRVQQGTAPAADDPALTGARLPAPSRFAVQFSIGEAF